MIKIFFMCHLCSCRTGWRRRRNCWRSCRAWRSVWSNSSKISAMQRSKQSWMTCYDVNYQLNRGINPKWHAYCIFQNDSPVKCECRRPVLVVIYCVFCLQAALEAQVLDEKAKAQRLQTELDVSEQVQKDFVKLSQTLQVIIYACIYGGGGGWENHSYAAAFY